MLEQALSVVPDSGECPGEHLVPIRGQCHRDHATVWGAATFHQTRGDGSIDQLGDGALGVLELISYLGDRHRRLARRGLDGEHQQVAMRREPFGPDVGVCIGDEPPQCKAEIGSTTTLFVARRPCGQRHDDAF
jgi:hypothetical protein